MINREKHNVEIKVRESVRVLKLIFHRSGTLNKGSHAACGSRQFLLLPARFCSA